MRYRIGVFGSAIADRRESLPLAGRVGRALARSGCTVITGACSGLPYEAAREAAGLGGAVWGFSPVRNLEEQRAFTPEDDPAVYSRLDFVPPDFPFASDLLASKKYRNVLSTATCDAGIVIQGRWGTLHEVASLVDFGKVIGVLDGSGELADLLPEVIARLGLDGGATLLRGDDPEELVALVMEALDARRR